MKSFGPVITAMVTPFDEYNQLNISSLRKLIIHLLKHGSTSLVITGTTGEAPTLTAIERLRIWETAVDFAGGTVPIIAGVGTNNTKTTIHNVKLAEEIGADAVLVVTPYYNKTSQSGLIASYTAIADATDLPVIMYNVPSRTGVNIAPETAKTLSAHPKINAIKEASGNISQVAKIAALCGDDLNIYSGNDDQIVPLLSLGGKGVISVLAHVAPQQTHDICQLWFDGKTTESSALQLKLLDLCNVLFCDVNPIPVKAAMNMLGYNAGECRLPLVSTSEANLAKIRAELTKYGILQ